MDSSDEIKKIFIIGSTGFIGTHVVDKAIEQNLQVVGLGLPDPNIKVENYRYELLLEDLNKLSLRQLVDMFADIDAVVYSVGPDDRELPLPGFSATDYYYSRLVTYVKPVVEACKLARVKKLIILGSYFSYFNNTKNPYLKIGQLAEHHPYIRARVRQESELIQLGGGYVNNGTDVVVLQVPYVFGALPGQVPIWKKVFIDEFAELSFAVIGRGGTNAIHVQKLAQLIVCAIYSGRHGDRLPLGDENLKLGTIIREFYQAMNLKKPVLALPAFILNFLLKAKTKKLEESNQESGLDYQFLASDILSKDLYFEPGFVHNYLGLNKRFKSEDYDVFSGIRESAKITKELIDAQKNNN